MNPTRPLGATSLEFTGMLEFGGGNRTRLQEAQAPEKKEVF